MSLMSIGTRAMQASYAALQTTGHNIANANTAGYSRQQVDLASAGGNFTGAGFFGRGVDVAGVSRSYDRFLTQQVGATRSAASADAERLTQLQRLEDLFPLGEAGLGYASAELFNAFGDLANAPQDAAARQVVLARAEELAARFQGSGERLGALQAGLVQDLASETRAVNALAQQVADANRRIAAVQGLGQPPNDLLDLRERLIGELASHVGLTTLAADDGSLGVFIGGGQPLVLGTYANSLVLQADPHDPAKARLALRQNGIDTALSPGALAGGSLAGLLRFQDEDLVDAQNLLGQMAAVLSDQANRQQALGLALGNPAAAGPPLFAVGAPQALAANTNARDASGAFIAAVSVTVVDATQLQASDYGLMPDPAAAGRYLLTRHADGLVRSIASGDTADGMTLTLAPPMASGERFLLRPVAAAAAGMRRVLDDARGLAAAAPVVASMGAANTGTASLASLAATAAPNPNLQVTLSFTSNAGDYAWSMLDTASGLPAGSGSGVWSPGQPIALNGWELRLDGLPKSGDTVRVQRTPNPAGNNGNALAFAALQDRTLVGRDAAGAGGASFTGAYAAALADIGTRVQSGRGAAELSAADAASAVSARANQSGVNLDEEAARLLQYQQSYQAAAKMLQAAQTVFDTLLAAMR